MAKKVKEKEKSIVVLGIEISDNEWRAISEAGKLFGLTDQDFV